VLALSRGVAAQEPRAKNPAIATDQTQPRTRDDARLVADLLAGDEDAFTALVRREHTSMVRYAQLFVSTRASAEEVAQEAWMGILAGLRRFEGRSSLHCWMYGIVANRAKSRGTREGRSVPLSALAEEDADDAVAPDRFFGPGSPQAGRWMRAPEPWADDLLEQAETLAVVREAIERLSGLRRQVIGLRDVEGWSAKETCSLLGITEGNQRILLHRARSRVRADLERHFAGRPPTAKSQASSSRLRNVLEWRSSKRAAPFDPSMTQEARSSTERTWRRSISSSAVASSGIALFAGGVVDGAATAGAGFSSSGSISNTCPGDMTCSRNADPLPA
jgi:RNA polymerase sigma-70 factor (ECF subfamily)